MNVRVCYILFVYCINNYLLGNQENTILKYPASSIIALRHFLKELATESDSDTTATQVNIFSQLTQFIDERFDTIRYSPLSYVEINYTQSPHLFVIAGLLQRKIVPHELMHVIQQGSHSLQSNQPEHKTIKPAIIKQTIAALYKSARLFDLERDSKLYKINPYSLLC